MHPSHEVDVFMPRPVWPAVHWVCIEGSRLSAVIGLSRSLWRPLAAAAEGADSSASKSVCLRRGEHPAERAGSGVWVGTPDPVDMSSLRLTPPPQQWAASQLPEGSHIASSRGKIPLGSFHIPGIGTYLCYVNVIRYDKLSPTYLLVKSQFTHSIDSERYLS